MAISRACSITRIVNARRTRENSEGSERTLVTCNSYQHEASIPEDKRDRMHKANRFVLRYERWHISEKRPRRGLWRELYLQRR